MNIIQKGVISGRKIETGAIVGKKIEMGAIVGKVVVPRYVGSKVYDGDYEVVPKAHDTQVLQTANKTMSKNLIVLEVPFFETSNENGTTVYIANEV